MTYVVIWSYEVSDSQISDFKQAYGHEGPWLTLFKKAPGFIKTDLLVDDNFPNHYITLDHWQSSTAYKAFKDDFHTQYQKIDGECEALTLTEEYIGGFNT